ncbi:putative Sortilin-related receptor [Hypsibius exemplaris]|uniref:Sortilin-related receptor n=1 Tax=Hypsibius exemplaris TaxID=2072580 RepID=A0A1W0X5A3_HYPEX|nr:putative Sortilin-related receptor [Hypsibius exemplaris]
MRFLLVATAALLQFHAVLGVVQQCSRVDRSVGFACSLGGWCNRNASLCNGLNDCLDGSDELNCPVLQRSPLAATLAGMTPCVQTNGAPGVKCGDSVMGCAPYDYFCDGEDDCNGGLDEQHCPPGTPRKGVSPCDRNDGTAGYRCLASGGEFCWPAAWKCDGGRDCADGRDELDCPNSVRGNVHTDLSFLLPAVEFPLCRRPTGGLGFTCRPGGFCFPAEFVCDGNKHCTDGADERNCPATRRTSAALPVTSNLNRCTRTNGRGFGFKCSSGLFEPCFDNSNACDGWRNCANDRDEVGCPNDRLTARTPLRPGQTACTRYDGTDGIVCAGGQAGDVSCMPHSWLCDGDRDCSDGSDEAQCGTSAIVAPPALPMTHAALQQACTDSEFRCNNGRCVPFRYRCDGQADCTDGSDEVQCPSGPNVTRRPISAVTPASFALQRAFSFRDVSSADCAGLRTQNCAVVLNNCGDPETGLWISCSSLAGDIETTKFLQKVGRLNADRGLDLVLIGERRLTLELFAPVASDLIALGFGRFPRLRMAVVTSALVQATRLQDLEFHACEGIIIQRNDFVSLPSLKMVSFTRGSTIASLEENAFASLPNLSHLSFEALIDTTVTLSTGLRDHLTRLHCSVQYKWLRDWLQSRPDLLAPKASGMVFAAGGVANSELRKGTIYIPVDCASSTLVASNPDGPFSSLMDA